MPGYQEFQQAVQQHIGRPLTQEELNDVSPTGILYNLPNELITLLPSGHLQMFDSARLAQLDNADLYELVYENPHIINQMPGYRFTGQGGFSGEQMQALLQRAGQQGIGGPGISEIQSTFDQLQGRVSAPPTQASGAPSTRAPTAPSALTSPGTQPTSTPSQDTDALLTLERERFYADLANQPGNFYNYIFRSRGLQPGGVTTPVGATTPPTVSAPGYQAPTTQAPGLGPAPSRIPSATNFTTQGATAGPQFYTGPIGAGQNPYGPGPFEERPDFNTLRSQVQAQGAEIAPGVLNPIIGQEIPTYRSQGGVPFFAPQTLAKMTPSERQLLAVTVNRTGGRAEDFFERSQRLGQFASRAPTIGYSGSFRGR